MENKNENVSLEDEEVERAVLAALLYNTITKDKVFKEIQSLRICARDFHKPAHYLIYNALTGTAMKNDQPVVVAVIETLRKRDQLELAGGEEYIKSLSGLYSDKAEPGNYFMALKQSSAKREFLGIAEQIQNDVASKVDNLVILEKIQLALSDLTGKLIPSGYNDLNDTLKQTMQGINDTIKNKSCDQSGFPELDNLLGIIYGHNYIVVLGNTDITTFALSIIVHISFNKKIPMAFFSLGIPSIVLMRNLLALDAEIPYIHLSAGYVTKNESQRLSKSVEKAKEVPLYIVDKPHMGILDIYSEAKKLRAERDVQVIFINQLDLITLESSSSKSSDNLVIISKFIKGLAKELNIPVIVLSQLDSSVDIMEPCLFDLGFLHDIKEDADKLIIMTERENDRKVKLRLEKNLNGRTGEAEINLPLKYTMFNKLPKADKFFHRGIGYFDKGKYDLAIADFSEAIRLDPYSTYAYCNRGEAYHEQGEYELALADFNEAIRINPSDDHAHYCKAQLFEGLRIERSKNDFSGTED